VAKISTLQDSFNNGFNTDLWTRTNDTNITIENNRLKMETSLSPAYYELESKAKYDLSDSFIQVHAITSGALTSSENYFIQLIKDSNNWYKLYQAGSTIYFSKRVGGSTTTVDSDTFTSGMTEFYIYDTGEELLSFAANSTESLFLISTANDDFDITELTVSISIGTWDTETETVSMLVDNINTSSPYLPNVGQKYALPAFTNIV